MDKEKLARYDAIVEKCPDIERKGKTVPYTSANGHMFSMMNKASELGIRFDKEVQSAYFEKFDTSHLTSHGATMRGYILITDVMLENEKLMISLLEESYTYVMGLPPK